MECRHYNRRIAGTGHHCTTCGNPLTPVNPKRITGRHKAVIGVLVVLIILAVLVGTLGEEDPAAAPSSLQVQVTATLPPESLPLCKRSDEKVYMAALVHHIQRIPETAKSIPDSFRQVKQNPALFFDDNWRSLIFLYLLALDDIYDTILALKAPATLSSVKAAADRMATESKRATTLVVEGVEQIDMRSVNGPRLV